LAQVYATFSGVDSVMRAIVPRTLGIVPNAIMLECVPQVTTLPTIGALTVGHGLNSVTMPDVKVDWAALRLSTGGHVMTVRLLDRRWRWRFGVISGRYNIRLADGTIDPATQKTPQQLAALLFEAMGEVGYDVTLLPNDSYPETDWSYDVPAIWLHQLCTDRGCDIALTLANTAMIVRLGEGGALPFTTDIQTPSLTLDPPEGPDLLYAVCGENQYESLLKLSAVGLDTDGSVKSIAALSYNPTYVPGGWSSIGDVNFFQTMRQNGATDQEIHLAKKTVYRWFKVTSMPGGTLDVPGYGTISDISQILPLNRHTLGTTSSAFSTRMVNAQARIYGMFVQYTDPPDDEPVDEIIEYDGDFVLDRATGIAKLGRRVFNYDSSGNAIAPTLYLQTSYGVRADGTDEQVRYIGQRNITGASSGFLLAEAHKYDELSFASRAEYNITVDPPTVTEVTDNTTELNAEVESILDGLQLQYTGSIGNQAIYRDIQPFNTDGAVRQVVWKVGPRGATTYASLNSETFAGPIRERERARRRLLAANADVSSRRLLQSRMQRKGHGRP
jgi:hypothetical protein